MSQASAATVTNQNLYDMKGGHFTVPTLIIRGVDIDLLDSYLADQVAKLPDFFQQAPVVIDVSGLDPQQPLLEFPMIVGMLRGHGMVPVGLRGASALQREQAEMLELAIMPNLRSRHEKPAVKAARPAPTTRVPAQIVEQPVRSGQRIYAEGRDLVLLAGVSSGAEVLADGHIHAYGPVRGRIMAGVTGDEHARIFCHDLAAELVAIAGRYRVSEDMDGSHSGHPVQVTLSGDALVFTRM